MTPGLVVRMVLLACLLLLGDGLLHSLLNGLLRGFLDGGMARVEREGTLGIYSCEIRNSAGRKGGAVYGDEGSFVSFVLCRIIGSRAAEAPAYSLSFFPFHSHHRVHGVLRFCFARVSGFHVSSSLMYHVWTCA